MLQKLSESLDQVINDTNRTSQLLIFQQSQENSCYRSINSMIIPVAQKESSLQSRNWELRFYEGGPGIVLSSSTSHNEVTYLSQSHEYAEPLVVKRSYWDGTIGPDIVEEFRLIFELMERREQETIVYTAAGQGGRQELVASIKDNSVFISRKYLQRYLRLKESHLIIGFWFEDHHCDKEKCPREDVFTDFTDNDFNYTKEHRVLNLSKGKYLTRFAGKKCVNLSDKVVLNKYGDFESRLYLDFVIDQDENGLDVLFSCNPDGLSSNFVKLPNSPHFLTPVFFRREVLKKYYDQHNIYAVEDGAIQCNDWVLPVDLHQKDYVSVYLGDLGKLPTEEQHHWKANNLFSSNAAISNVSFHRDILGSFSPPTSPDLIFKQTLLSFEKKWLNRFKFNLFLPLTPEDSHHIKSLSLLTSHNQKEFDEKILSLSKITIDSINRKDLLQRVDTKQEESIASIKLMQLFLEMEMETSVELPKTLQKIQAIRSQSVAHRKSQNPKGLRKTIRYFCDDVSDLNLVFLNILNRLNFDLSEFESLL